jgi:hypothetical protein
MTNTPWILPPFNQAMWALAMIGSIMEHSPTPTLVVEHAMFRETLIGLLNASLRVRPFTRDTDQQALLAHCI